LAGIQTSDKFFQ